MRIVDIWHAANRLLMLPCERRAAKALEVNHQIARDLCGAAKPLINGSGRPYSPPAEHKEAS